MLGSKGNAEYALNLFDAAEVSWREALRVNPDDGMAFSNLGLLYDQKGDYSQAEKHYRRATKLSPDSAHVWMILGTFLFEHNQLLEALNYLEKSTHLDTFYHMAWFNKGLVLEALGRKKDAFHAFIIAHSLDIDDLQTLVCLVYYLIDLQKEHVARRFLRFASNIEPENSEVKRLSHLLQSADDQETLRSEEVEPYKGSNELLDYALSELTLPTNANTVMSVAFAFDIFGLPNGKKNPSRGSSMRMTRGPDIYEIRDAFRQVINPLLDEKEKWLLSIPIGFANQPSTDASCYLSKWRECAIVFYAGIFGGLFSANERVEVIREEMRSKNSSSISPFEFAQLLERFLLGAEVATEHFHFLTHDYINPERTYKIWKITTIQQVFMLLHEFGHLYYKQHPSLEPRGSGIFRRRFSSYDDEFQADLWAAKHIMYGIPGVAVSDPLELDSAIVRLFGYFEILRKNGKYDPSGTHPLPVERWLNVAPLLAPLIAGERDSQLFKGFERITRTMFSNVDDFIYLRAGS